MVDDEQTFHEHNIILGGNCSNSKTDCSVISGTVASGGNNN